ncbi:MAG: biopolymer transporter ExbD [Verrucomicrobia bacterium]|nr:biopolymer transporter ExbD [Verrucomicrobiota bacterium]
MKLKRTVQLNTALILIVPILDIVFLILLLFLISGTLLARPGIKVTLPFSKFALSPEKSPLILTVTAGPLPEIFFRDQRVTPEELAAQLAKENPAEKSVIIRADRLAPQGSVVDVLNICLDRGFSVSLATSPQPSE